MARYPRHPLVWTAFVLLLLNDHVLKGSGLLPGDITGKLSDFAWLIVAPAFAAALFGLRTVEARGALLSVFVGLFVATELSQGAADGVAALATGVGIPSRLWADPTDLIALSVLPLTWHVMTHVEGRGGRPVRMDQALGRVAMGLGIFASVATTNPPPRNPTWATGGYVVNRSGAPIDVRVRWTSALIDCETLATADLSRAVSGVIFDEAITYRLLEDETVPLERADPDAPSVPPMPTGQCQLALIAVDGASDLIVLVPPDTMTVRATQTEVLDVPERAVTITLRAPGYDLTSALRSGVRDDRLRESDCAVRPAFATSAPPRGTARTVVERIEGADGCTTLVFDDGERAFLCVPADLIPFSVGDTFSNVSSGPSARFESETHALVVVSVSNATSAASLLAAPFTLALAGPEPCEGIRSACGAYTQPFAVEVTGGEPMAADRFVSGDARLAIGRAEHRIIAPPGCDIEHTTLGSTLQYAELLPL